MEYHIAVCDDEPQYAENISSAVSEWAKKYNSVCKISVFPSAGAFLFAFDEKDAFDILFLDVEMKGTSGIELAKLLRSKGSRAEIVFVTSHFEFVGEGYEVDALHYLVKPVAKEKLFEVLSKAAAKLEQEPAHIVIFCGGETVKLYESDILYAESFLHDIVIHTKNGEYRTKENISVLEQKLSKDFFRVHRSYIVNLKTVTRISRTSVVLNGKTEIPVARGKYDDINRAFIERN